MSFLNIFKKKKKYEGEVVYLQESYRVDEKTAYDGVPTVYYDIYNNDSKDKVGSIDLRLTVEGDMYYYGHVGYNIKQTFRGNHYAYYACKILFNIAATEFDIKELIITCSPENIASYKTLMKLGGELIDFVEVPKHLFLYKIGEKTKYVFKYKLGL